MSVTTWISLGLTVAACLAALEYRRMYHEAAWSAARLTAIYHGYEQRVAELEAGVESQAQFTADMIRRYEGRVAELEGVPAGPLPQACRCDVCGRVVEGVPGAACPGCGEGEHQTA